MPKNSSTINRHLYDMLITKGFEVKMLDSAGKEVPVPDEADVFQFKFEHDGNSYGTVTITIDGVHQMVVYYNDSVVKGMRGSLGEDSAWVQFLKQLKKFSQKRQIGFKLSDMNRLGYDMKTRNHNKKINEGYYGNRHTSYSDSTPPTVKMIIKHSRALEETDKRYLNVEKIFLENSQGERVLVPSRRPSVGRVFARHIAEGGVYNDQRWNHLAEMVEDISKLGGFVRATRSKQFNESAQQVISEAVSKYQELRETLKKMQSSRGYNKYFESWKPTINENDDSDTLSEVFKVDTIDPRIESAIPILNKMNIKISEMAESQMFEQWAESVIFEKLRPNTPGQVNDLLDLVGPDSEYMAVGPDGMNAINELQGVLEDDELNNRILQAAKTDSDRDARPIVIAWMSEQSGSEYKEILDKLQPTNNSDSVEQSAKSPEAEKKPSEEESSDVPPPPVKEESILEDETIRILKKLSGF